jgi:hypothetical protein
MHEKCSDYYCMINASETILSGSLCNQSLTKLDYLYTIIINLRFKRFRKSARDATALAWRQNEARYQPCRRFVGAKD